MQRPDPPQLPPIVALSGPAGVGKSTVARALARLAPTIDLSFVPDRATPCDSPLGARPVPSTVPRRAHLPTEGTVVSLAAPLKAMLRALGVPEECLTGSLADKERPLDVLCGRSARHAMQTLGTEWGCETMHANLWLRTWQEQAVRACTDHPYSLIVVDDVRFENEAAYLRELGAVVVRLFRGSIGYEGSHASEAGAVTYHAGVELDAHERRDSPADCDRRNAQAVLEAVASVHARRAARGESSALLHLLNLMADADPALAAVVR